MTVAAAEPGFSKRDLIFVGTCARRSPHFEVQLELMIKHAGHGARLTFVQCNGDAITHCEANPFHRRLECRMCTGKRDSGFRAVGVPVERLDLGELISHADASDPFRSRIRKEFGTLAELADYKFDGFDCGEAVKSWFISEARNLEPDVTKHRDYVSRAVESSVSIHVAFRTLLRRRASSDTLVYLFNGRGPTHRAVLRACQSEGVDFYTHERGSHVSKYLLVPGTVPHNIEYRKRLIDEIWEAGATDPDRDKIGREFFGKRRKGILTYNPDVSFIRHQQSGSLPDDWMSSAERIVMLGTTESERAALQGFNRPGVYPTQAEGMCRIVEALAAASFTGKLVIRLHPNSKDEIGPLEEKLRGYDFPFLRVVGATAPTDTYALIATATKAAVFWSNAGIEAAFDGLPVVLIGRAMYEGVGATYNPQTHEEVVNLLLAPLAPKPTEGCIKYGYYMANYGTPLKHVEMIGRKRCRLNGHRVAPPFLLRHYYKLVRWLGRWSKMYEADREGA
jgi:hypothetical protein